MMFRNIHPGKWKWLTKTAIIFISWLFLASSPRPKEVVILFGGDTGFGELWHQNYERKGKPNILKEKGYDHQCMGFAPLMENSDLVIANLETPLVKPGTSGPFDGKKKWINPGDPVKGPETLAKFGLNAVSLANNHSFDKAENGLFQTMDALNSAGIEYFGAGRNLNQAKKPWVKKYRNFHLYVLPCYWTIESMEQKFRFYAREDRAGVNPLNMETLKFQIDSIRNADHDAYIVVFPHWGSNYKDRSGRQADLAHRIIDAGADILIGQGAHKMQEIEYYRDHWILYNLGNFIYGTPGRYKKMKAFPFSLVASLTADTRSGTLQSLKIYPFYCDNRKTNYQARTSTEVEMKEVLNELIKKENNKGILKSLIESKEDAYGNFFELSLQNSKN